MSGRFIAGGLVAFALIFGVALWWFQTRGHYSELTGLDSIMIAGASVPVANYRGVDAATSPLKLRGCFDMAPAAAPVADDPVPLVAPGWFDCFDAETIAADLSSGVALPLLAEANAPYGFDRIIAHYPDGRAFQWRQINDCGHAHFAGDPLPVGCPAPPKDRTDG